jgi:hypothetical protein
MATVKPFPTQLYWVKSQKRKYRRTGTQRLSRKTDFFTESGIEKTCNLIKCSKGFLNFEGAVGLCYIVSLFAIHRSSVDVSSRPLLFGISKMGGGYCGAINHKWKSPLQCRNSWDYLFDLFVWVRSK